MTELVCFFGSLFFFLFLGVPIAVVLLICAILLMALSGSWDVMTIPNSMMDAANNYPLMAIPFFVFAGEIMAAGGLSKRVVQVAQLMVGRIKGGLGYAAIVASIIFAGLMGSSVGEAAALGGLLLPMMQKVGYNRGRAGGLIASGALLGPIIPPSTNFIILGSTISGLSITRLFMIGLVPGLILGLGLMIVWWFVVRKDGYTETITFTRREAVSILLDASPAFMLPVLLLGGIRFGVFTPTEGGAFAAVFAILVCMAYYRELSFRDLLRVSAVAARTTAVVMLIVATASAVGYFITLARIPTHITTLFSSFIDSPFMLLTLIMIFLLFAGMVMDLTPNILIFAPVFYPLIQAAGINEYHFGLLMVLNLGIGVITPPVGTVLYVVCGIGNIKLGELVTKMLPFVLVEIVILFLLVYFPQLSLTPLRWLM
jgi:tripartite ATP-independent transporter DctM subunit